MLNPVKNQIVSVKQMIDTEQNIYSQGVSESELMESAGTIIANEVEKFCFQKKLDKIVTLLVGKGNNGGDAYVAGTILLQKGFVVECYSLSSGTPLSNEKREIFQKAGGKISDFTSEILFKGILVDGLLGTGFHGELKEDMMEIIQKVNESHLPVLSIDVPSGLNADTGIASPIAIKATGTIFLGLPKIGFFLEQGLDYVGELVFGDLGIKDPPKDFIAHHMMEDEAAKLLPEIHRTRHKYQAGYLLTVAGVEGMSGATALSTKASLRSGAGIVRLFYTPGLEGEITNYSLEIVKEEWNGKDAARILQESKRAKVLLIGPGLGRTNASYLALKKIIQKVKIPLVLDGDALYFLAEHSSLKIPPGSVLTPQRQEMTRFFREKHTGYELFEACRQFAKERQVTIVFKGAATFIFTPNEKPVCITRGDPGMATAGSGDVLAGIITSFIAQGLKPEQAAMLGVFLHGLSGEFAAKKRTSYAVIASDIIKCLPDALSHLLKL